MSKSDEGRTGPDLCRYKEVTTANRVEEKLQRTVLGTFERERSGSVSGRIPGHGRRGKP